MTGPEHYAEAERVLDHAEDHAEAESDAWYANACAAAQVHATLALAASNVNAYHSIDPARGDLARTDWARVLS